MPYITLLAALSFLFFTAAVTPASSQPAPYQLKAPPGSWFIKGEVSTHPAGEYDYYDAEFFASEGDCVHALQFNENVRSDLMGYMDAERKAHKPKDADPQTKEIIIQISCAKAPGEPGERV